ncbi:hypothetical protein I4U23_011154 [Adineta vaga]|nr:hypothetical protein I4U23_011154 [Adineta vaga]
MKNKSNVNSIDYFNDFHNTNRSKKHLTAMTSCGVKEKITHFEDLANEIIYEVFEYLDFFNIYKGFFHINYRFRYVVMESTLIPIKINIPLMSQSTFVDYNQDIIIPNIQRIHIVQITIDEYSSIEHLIIIDSISVYQLVNLLSYVPHLRYLSAYLSNSNVFVQTNLPNFTLNNLTSASFTFQDTTFHHLEQILMNRFSFIEILRITSDSTCIDGNRWKQLILTYLTNLHVFDIFLIQHDMSNDDTKEVFEEQISPFQSSFWIERQWFFDYRLEKVPFCTYGIISSVGPYRKKDFTLRVQLNEMTIRNENRIIFKSVNHLLITNENALNQCMNYFPNITELTLKNPFSIDTYGLIGTSLNRILSLEQVKTLVIQLECFSILNLIDLLCSMPNIHTLTLHTMTFFKQNKTSIEQNENFQLLFKTNRIKNVIFLQKCCALSRLEILVMLFPHLEYLEINIEMNNIESILRFLLDENNQINRHLNLLCFQYVQNYDLKHFNSLINSGILRFNHKTIYINERLYLWSLC